MESLVEGTGWVSSLCSVLAAEKKLSDVAWTGVHHGEGQLELRLPSTRPADTPSSALHSYAAPFDRHDWVIDRCGHKVRYIIDFYSGGSASPAGNLSFYLDVRPAPDTVEGIQMRMARLFFGGGTSSRSR